MSSSLLNRDHHKEYYQGMPRFRGTGPVLRRHGDEVERFPGGYYIAHGRSDDTMNLGGIKTSAVEIERACNSAAACVLETAAVGVAPSGGGPEELVVFCVLRPGATAGDREGLLAAFRGAVRTQLNPLFKVHRAVEVPSLPRTASNKVMRRVLRDQLRGEDAPRARL
mmetsp:Transcript_69763/g.220909  ORF Transcript_69763/g.220909 Transcript_69763/m.220909 type:complete len:167 (+) Transcript_69763:1799-2299(+)